MPSLLKEIHRVRKNSTCPKPVPTAIQVNITGKCPCRCWHCEKADEAGGSHIPVSSLEKYQAMAHRWNCPILYSGGEPLVHPQWRQVLQSGTGLGVVQKLITSGVTFNKLQAEDLELLQGSLGELLISLDSADGPTHDRLRGIPGLFGQIIDYLEGAPRPDRVWIIHVPFPDWNGTREVLDLASSLKVGLIVQPYIYSSNFPHLAPLPASQSVKSRLPGLAAGAAGVVAELVDLSRKLGVVSNLEEVQQYIFHYYDCANSEDWFGTRVLPTYSCSVPWQQVTIDEFERVQPCVFLPGIPVPDDGDLYETWRVQALDLRNSISEGKTWPQCASCSCHFSSNFRNSILADPWANRKGLGVLARKFYRKTRGRFGF